MKYYIAIKKPLTVHTACTRLRTDHRVQVDITKEEAFNIYSSLKKITLFKDMVSAEKNAILHSSPHNYNKFFTIYPLENSKDTKLNSIYGDNNVLMQIELVTIYFQVEKLDLKQSQDVKAELTDNLTLNANEKKQLKLQAANIRPFVIYLTDEYAKSINKPTTIEFIDHTKLTNNKAICTIL